LATLGSDLGEDGPTDRPENGLDPVWSLLDQAAEIDGSGDAHGSHRVEEDLYGPAAPVSWR
jgi:hypothetical protein